MKLHSGCKLEKITISSKLVKVKQFSVSVHRLLTILDRYPVFRENALGNRILYHTII